MQEKNRKSYNKEEVEKATLQYFNGDELATDVWIKKYCLKDENKLYELSPDDMHRRIAKELARVEAKYPNALTEEQIYKTLKGFKRIIAGGSPMSGIGNDIQITSLGNCFVIGNKLDSYGSILEIDQEQVQLMKRRGGVGHDLSYIRPNSSPVKNDAISSTGVVPFMERYSNSTKEVAQCLHESTLIMTKGGLKQIKDVVVGDYVWTENQWVTVLDVLQNKKKTYKIKTKFGNEIIASKDHIFTSFKAEKKLSDFKLDDEIDMIWGGGTYGNKYVPLIEPDIENSGNRLIIHKLPELLNEDVAYLLGYMYGDGSMYKAISKTTGTHTGTEISFACALDRPEIIEKLKIIWNELFGSNLIEKKCDGEWMCLGICSQQIYKFLLANDIAKEKAGSLIFPDKILKSPSSVQLSFISGYFDADGYASDKKKGYVFSSIDKDFLLNIKYILSSLGILTKLHDDDRSKKKWQTLYSLCVVGAFSKINLKNMLTESLKLGKATLSANRDCFLSIYKAKDLFSLNQGHNKYSYIPDDSQYLSTNVIRKAYSDYLKFKISNPVIYQDYVKSVEEFEEESVVYDLVLENTHLFWANGFYAHNSGRRGALMLSISIKHPDSEDFIDAKLVDGKVTGANVSVKLDDEFMRAALEDKPYTVQFPIDSITPKFSKEISAKKLWNKIIYNAWKSAEPGVLFWDTLKNESVSSCYGEDWSETSTNPCAELPLPPYDSCRLLSLNLFSYVINPFTDESYFDWEFFKSDVIIAERYMDDIVDLELEKIDKIISKIDSDPEPENFKSVEKKLWTKIRHKAESGRRTGLGITAEGDMLAALNLRYGTDPATDFAEEVHKVLKLSAYRSSVIMAKERGAFPIYNSENEVNNPFVLRIKQEDPRLYNDMITYGRRNLCLLTIAPTGTLSICTQTTSGVEPVFLVVYMRRRKINPQEKNVRIDFVDDEGVAWMEYPVFHHKFEMWLTANNYDITVVKTMTKEQLDEIVKKSPYYKATSNDVDWVRKVEMQGRIQKHLDHSISSTVNVPNNATEELISKIYETGWRSGCKGLTVYRDGCRSGVLVAMKNKKEKVEIVVENHAPKRPKRLKGEIHRFQNNLEKWIAVVGIKDGRPYEIFTGVNANGLSKLPLTIKECEIVKNIVDVEELNEYGELVKVKKKRYDIEYIDADGVKQVHTGLNHAFNPEFWNYAKLISGVLRHGMPIIYVYELIDSLNFKEDYINTWKNGVARTVKKYIKDGEKIEGKCPECGGTEFIFAEGCIRCSKCSWSKCG